MKEENKELEVLLVKEPQSDKLKAVSGMDENGNLKTVPATKAHEQDFMKFDRYSNMLESFFTNFMRQAKAPSSFSFFKTQSKGADVAAEYLDDLIPKKDDVTGLAYVNNAKVNPEDYLKQQKEQAYKPHSAENVDWEMFEKIGVKRETLERSGALKDMLNYRKSPTLIPINFNVDSMNISTDARLALRQGEDGRLTPVVYAIGKAPQLDRQFYGNTFSDEDKKALRETGNLGRVIELKIPNREPVKALVSIDKLTNDIVATNVDKVRIPNEVKGRSLDDKQKQELLQGKAVFIEGMMSKKGEPFSAYVQFNADKRGLEFKFDNTLKHTQAQHETQVKEKNLRVPDKMLGREISPEEKVQLREGKVVYMEGLIDKKGKPFNAYVKPNFEQGKFDFLRWNPEKSQEIKPDNKSETQVAVNSEGKTNEATKDIKEPLKQEQTTPSEAQQKPRGMRM